MTPEAQRIAIAEACDPELDIGLMEVCHCGDAIKNHGYDHAPVPMLSWRDIPDYLSDLNAMHEAEKTLSQTNGERAKYCRSLAFHIGDLGVIMSTAAQRAEAFLRTIGKWDDSK